MTTITSLTFVFVPSSLTFLAFYFFLLFSIKYLTFSAARKTRL